MDNNVFEEIERLSGLLITPAEIVLHLDLDAEVYKQFYDTESLVYKAYQKGKIKTKIELRTKLFHLAKNGAPGAEDMVEKYSKEIEHLDRVCKLKISS